MNATQDPPRIPVGQPFDLYVYAAFGDRIDGWAEHRIKTPSGSRVTGRSETLMRWPRTNAGGRAAAAWSLAQNVAQP